MPFEVSCTNEQKVKVQVTSILTAAGNPAQVDGAFQWEAQTGTGTVEVIDDTSAYLISGDVPGDTIYSVQADADLGEGIVPIVDLITLHVTGAQAASFGFTASTPELK